MSLPPRDMSQYSPRNYCCNGLVRFVENLSHGVGSPIYLSTLENPPYLCICADCGREIAALLHTQSNQDGHFAWVAEMPENQPPDRERRIK